MQRQSTAAASTAVIIFLIFFTSLFSFLSSLPLQLLPGKLPRSSASAAVSSANAAVGSPAIMQTTRTHVAIFDIILLILLSPGILGSSRCLQILIASPYRNPDSTNTSDFRAFGTSFVELSFPSASHFPQITMIIWVLGGCLWNFTLRQPLVFHKSLQ